MESNARRKFSPKDDKYVSASWIGEPASNWRSPEIAAYAEQGMKAMCGIQSVVGIGMNGRLCERRVETCFVLGLEFIA